MLLVVFILAVSYVSTVAAQQSSNTTSTITPGSNQTCQTDFSADLYGLGVRLGYYFNWASGWTANNFVPDEIAGAQDSNSIFLLGVLASLLRGTMTGRLTRLDGLVLLELAAGTVWSVLSLWGYRTCVFKRERLHGISFLGGFGTHFRLLLSTMMASYGLWFFVVGVAAHNDNHLKLASDIGQSPAHCRQILVLGVRLETVRPVGIVLCLISLAYCGIMLVTSSVAGITRLWKMGWLMRHSHYSSSSRLRYISGLGQQHRSVYYAYENFRAGNGQIRPSLGLDTSIHPSVPTLQRTSIGRTMTWWLRLLSQSLHDSHSDAGEMKKNDDVQAVHDEWPTWQKILTAWLPWISVLSFWPWDKSERAKRIEGLNGEQQGKEAPESMTTGRHGAEP